MTKLQEILSRLYGYNIEEAEKEILAWHNSKQLTEGEITSIINKWKTEHNLFSPYSLASFLAHSIKEAMDNTSCKECDGCSLRNKKK